MIRSIFGEEQEKNHVMSSGHGGSNSQVGDFSPHLGICFSWGLGVGHVCDMTGLNCMIDKKGRLDTHG